MNWIQVYNTSPAAFEVWWTKELGKDYNKMHDFLSLSEHLSLDDWHISLRDLYDFFDSHEIWVRVNILYWNDPVEFKPDVATVKGLNSYSLFAQTRQQAEEYAFARAFELLEQQLG